MENVRALSTHYRKINISHNFLCSLTISFSNELLAHRLPSEALLIAHFVPSLNEHVRFVLIRDILLKRPLELESHRGMHKQLFQFIQKMKVPSQFVNLSLGLKAMSLECNYEKAVGAFYDANFYEEAHRILMDRLLAGSIGIAASERWLTKLEGQRRCISEWE